MYVGWNQWWCWWLTHVDVQRCRAQDPVIITDSRSNITFATWSIYHDPDPNAVQQGDYSFGMVLPPTALTTDSDEYIGYLVTPTN